MSRDGIPSMQELMTPPPGLPADRAGKWVREGVMLYANDLALMVMVGDTDEAWAMSEISIALLQRAARCTDPRGAVDLSDTLFPLVWRQAGERAGRILDGLRRRIAPLGRVGAPGAQIILAAEDVLRPYDCHLPREALLELLHDLAIAAHRPRRSGNARAYR